MPMAEKEGLKQGRKCEWSGGSALQPLLQQSEFPPCADCAGCVAVADSGSARQRGYFLLSCSSSFFASSACGAVGAAARNFSRSAFASGSFVATM